MMAIDTIYLAHDHASSREGLKAIEGAHHLGYRCLWGSEALRTLDRSRTVPVGSVEFCEDWLGRHPEPNFYPAFLAEWRHRTIVLRPAGEPRHSNFNWFVKSAERYKAFPAQIIAAGGELPDGDLMLSEVVEFVQEWRYYVVDGVVLATGWYDGDDAEEPAPELHIDWPKGFCGAVDFGRLADGRLALVESHHPYACGWYGDDSSVWVVWLIAGWEFMNAK